jgi:hypothetical protein
MGADPWDSKAFASKPYFVFSCFFQGIPGSPGSRGQQRPTVVRQAKWPDDIQPGITITAITYKEPNPCQTHIYICLILLKQALNMVVVK